MSHEHTDFITWHTHYVFSLSTHLPAIHKGHVAILPLLSLHIKTVPPTQHNAAMETVICWLLFLFYQSDKVDPFKKKCALVSDSYSV